MEEGHNQFTDFELGSVSSSSSSDDEKPVVGGLRDLYMTHRLEELVSMLLGLDWALELVVGRLPMTTRGGDISPRGGSARARSPMPPR